MRIDYDPAEKYSEKTQELIHWCTTQLEDTDGLVQKTCKALDKLERSIRNDDIQTQIVSCALMCDYLHERLEGAADLLMVEVDRATYEKLMLHAVLDGIPFTDEEGLDD